MENFTDEQLIALALKKDKAALEYLISRYLDLVYRFVFRYVRNRQDAEDVTQEVFTKFWRSLALFEEGKPLRPWLYTIAKNASLDLLKKKAPRVITDLDSIENSEWLAHTGTPDPERSAEQGLLKGKLNAVLSKLSPKYSEIISLKHQDDLNFREIAELKGESVNTIKSRYRRAISALRDLWDNR